MIRSTVGADDLGELLVGPLIEVVDDFGIQVTDNPEWLAMREGATHTRSSTTLTNHNKENL
jgi:hypothetical protein